MTAHLTAPHDEAVRVEDSLDWDAVRTACLRAMEEYAQSQGLAVVEEDAEGPFDLRVLGVPFPDGVGVGELRAWGETVLGRPRVRIELQHNRVFAGSERPVYLNDYKFARRLDAAALPSQRTFVEAFRAAEDARTAVERVRQRSKGAGASVVFMSLNVAAQTEG